MQYRVHYILADRRDWATVEAPSPEQAKIRFRHSHPAATHHGRQADVVSVCPETRDDEPSR